MNLCILFIYTAKEGDTQNIKIKISVKIVLKEISVPKDLKEEISFQ